MADDPELTEEQLQRFIDNFVAPQIRANELQDAGVLIDTGIVNTNMNAPGFTVTCSGCGRTAKLPSDPGTKIAVCPRCARSQGFL